MSVVRCLDCGSANVHAVQEPSSPSRHKGGPVPYGFNVWDGEYRFDIDEGPVLTWIMRSRAQGVTLRALATNMNALGYKGPAGGEWNHGSVARVIKQGKRLSHLIPIQHVLGTN